MVKTLVNMDFEINKIKYLTLIGHIQSGKTHEEINYCFESVNTHELPVIFIVRNIKEDSLQLRARFGEICPKLNVKIFSHLTIQSAVEFMDTLGIIILLCNEHQLLRMKQVLQKYRGDYNLCIDEVDFSIKTKTDESIIDVYMDLLKQGANHILGATATPIAIFSSESNNSILSKVKKLNPKSNYQGIENLNVKFVEPCINKSMLSDLPTITSIYSSLLQKEHAIILHTVKKEKVYHSEIFDILTEWYPEFTTIIYNGDGIKVMCKNRNGNQLTKSRKINKYGSINKYFHGADNIHYFINWSISEVLQILADDSEYNHSHISIISGHLASRGISFVSSDYSLHLTDQYFHPSILSHGENLLQSLRILGCYKDNRSITLWCSEKTWKSILSQNKIINKLVLGINNDSEWLFKIKEITFTTPEGNLTRPALNNKLISDGGESKLKF